MSRAVGIDFGLKRIGIALSDESKTIASPFRVEWNDRSAVERIARLCREYAADLIVVGMPFTDEGSSITESIERFAKELAGASGLPVEWQDETLTTAEATRVLRELGYRDKKIKEIVDKYSAQRILADYLERTREK